MIERRRIRGMLLAIFAAGAVLLGATYDRQETWEYHVVRGGVSPAVLNRAGAEGWELVAVFEDVHGEGIRRVPSFPDEDRLYGTLDATITSVFKRPAR